MSKASSIEHLLNRAGTAHGAYEATVLNGVYDEDWPTWYASWAIEHGFNDLVARPVDPVQLSRLLADLNEQHRQTDRRQSWAQFTAERLAGLLGKD